MSQGNTISVIPVILKNLIGTRSTQYPEGYYEFKTLWGDGEFTDDEGRRFFVDTGRFCFVRADCAKPKKDIIAGALHKIEIRGKVTVSLDTCKIHYE